MIQEPDYSQYTFFELQQSLRDIDRAKFPERAEKIEKEINTRPEAQSMRDSRLNSEREDAPKKINKRMGLVLIEVPMFSSIFIRLLCISIAYMYIGNILEALDTGTITRRGNEYTVEDNPSAYYTRFSLYALIAFLNVWYATFGTRVKISEQGDKN